MRFVQPLLFEIDSRFERFDRAGDGNRVFDVVPFGFVEQFKRGVPFPGRFFEPCLGQFPAMKPVHQGGVLAEVGSGLQMHGRGLRVAQLVINQRQSQVMMSGNLLRFRAMFGGKL